MSRLGRAIRSRRWRREHKPVVPPPAGRPPVPIETPTSGNMMQQRAAGVGARFSFVLTGTTTGGVWGNLVYTDDSSLAAAAVHAGVLANGQTSVVVVELTNAPSDYYSAVRRNGVSSRYWPNTWGWAYKFVGGAAPPLQEQYELDAFLSTDTSFGSPITRVDEGQAFYFVLRTRNVAGGTSIPYSLSGFETGDVKDAFGNNIATSGNIIVAYTANGDSINARGSLYVSIPANISPGDNNRITLTLNNGKATCTVTVRDTSPTYRLRSNSGSVEEGQTITITLSTTNIANGTAIPYTITSPQGLDIFRGVPYALSTPHPMTGNFVIQNSIASASFEIKNDAITEGQETFTLKLNNNLATISVAIFDTSRSPPPPVRPPIVRAVTATMRLICERATTPPLSGRRPTSGPVYGPVPVGAYRYAQYGRVVAVDFEIQNAPVFSTFTPNIYYSTNGYSWTAIPSRRLSYIWRRLLIRGVGRWFNRRQWVNRRGAIYKNIAVGPIGLNTSARATYRMIDSGHFNWSPTPATYLSSFPPYSQPRFAFWPFYPQTDQNYFVNSNRLYKIVLPSAAGNLEFVFRLY